jgi:hypothetical protein
LQHDTPQAVAHQDERVWRGGLRGFSAKSTVFEDDPKALMRISTKLLHSASTVDCAGKEV